MFFSYLFCAGVLQDNLALKHLFWCIEIKRFHRSLQHIGGKAELYTLLNSKFAPQHAVHSPEWSKFNSKRTRRGTLFRNSLCTWYLLFITIQERKERNFNLSFLASGGAILWGRIVEKKFKVTTLTAPLTAWFRQSRSVGRSAWKKNGLKIFPVSALAWILSRHSRAKFLRHQKNYNMSRISW